jgi:hypothetical protein
MGAKRIAILCAGYSAFLLLLVVAFARGLLSPRALGVVGLLGMIGFALIFFTVFKNGAKRAASVVVSPSAPLDATTRRQRIRTIRSCKLLVLVLVLSLLYGLLQVGKASLFPELAGIIVNLCITTSLIYVIVRLQRSLR